jgi:2,4-dienoyl-CoA reductase-like NADH-dependent reductase (Old Yellow Enzyme family)
MASRQQLAPHQTVSTSAVAMVPVSNRPRIQSQVVDQKILGNSIKLPASGLVAPSRFMKAAMTERLSSWDQHNLEKRGIPSDVLIKAYEEWGKGGFGIILSEHFQSFNQVYEAYILIFAAGNTMVNPVDIEAPGNPIIHKPFETPERIDAFRRQAEAAKAHGSLVYVQLSHAGRQAGKHLQPNPISASDVQLEDAIGMSFAKPRAMTLKDIDDVVDQVSFCSLVLPTASIYLISSHTGLNSHIELDTMA